MADKRIVFRDVDLRFKPNPVTGDIPVLINGDAAKQALRNTVLTNHFERFMRPFFGGNIRAQLFENIDRLTEMIVEQDLKRTINNDVPQVILDKLDVSAPETPQRNTLNAAITFRIRNLSSPIEVKLFLGRVR